MHEAEDAAAKAHAVANKVEYPLHWCPPRTAPYLSSSSPYLCPYLCPICDTVRALLGLLSYHIHPTS